LGSR